jgi:hypothetical protein
MNTSLKQQLSVVRLSLAVNNTLADVEYNENLLREGVSKVTEYMNTLKLETNEKNNLFSAKIDRGTNFKGKQCNEYLAT